MDGYRAYLPAHVYDFLGVAVFCMYYLGILGRYKGWLGSRDSRIAGGVEINERCQSVLVSLNYTFTYMHTTGSTSMHLCIAR